jgi:AcrR family transcriptional regulator
MGKADDRRAVILDRLADHVLDHGLAASSLRTLANTAGVSDRMLLYYFTDKAEVMTATIGVVAGRLETTLAARISKSPMPLARLRPLLLGVVMADDLWPFMRLWLEIASLAARGDAFYRATGEAIGRGFLDWGAAQLDCATLQDRARDAARLLVDIEGALLLKSIGLSAVSAAAFSDRAPSIMPPDS